MSIIYATLERLEEPTSAMALQHEKPGLPQPARKSPGLPVKTMATVLLAVITGFNLMLWHRSSEAVAAGSSASADTATQTVPTVYNDNPVSKSVAESPVAPVETIDLKGGADQLRDAMPTETPPAEVTVTQVEQPVLSEQEVPEIPLMVATVAEAEVAVDSDDTPIAEPDVAAAKSESGEAAETETEVAVASYATVPANPAGIDEGIERARVALSRGEYMQALSGLQQLGPAAENRADFWLIKGSILLAGERLEAAETAFASAQALAPDNVQIAVQQAIVKQEQGDHSGALQILEAAAARDPYVPEVVLNQGYSYQALGATREAKRCFRQFLDLTENRSLYAQQRKVIEGWLAQVPASQH